MPDQTRALLSDLLSKILLGVLMLEREADRPHRVRELAGELALLAIDARVIAGFIDTSAGAEP